MGNMKVHFDPIVYTVRLYDDNFSYENRDPYTAIMTIQKMDSVAFMHSMKGEISREHLIDILSQLKDFGVTYIIGIRHNTEKRYNIDRCLKKLKAS